MAPTRTALLAKAASASPLLAVLGQAQAQLAPRGLLGVTETAALCERAQELSAEGFLHITLDLARVAHWDYRCLPALARLARTFRARGGGLQLTSPNRYLATVLRFGGLEDLIVDAPVRAASVLARGGLGA